MSKRDSVEEKLAELGRLRERGSSLEGLAHLRKALGGRISLVVARAAEVAGELEAEEVSDALEQAFERFMVNPAKVDKGCQAKTAIVAALHKVNACSAHVYLRGIRHVQMEPSYGGSVDTAAELRGLSAMGLVAMNHPDAMNELARLLTDKEPDARIMAARAIAYTGDSRGEPLLRHKAHCGDEDPQVFAECLLALLHLAPEASLEFVTEFLNSGDPDLVEPAAGAMGESRNPKALAPLQAAYRGASDASIRQAMLLAIASLRCDEGAEFLLGELADAEGKTAEAVLSALATFRHDPAIRRRVSDIVDQSRDRELARAFRASFDV